MLLEQCAKLIFTVLYNYLDPSAVSLDSLVRPSLLSLPILRAEWRRIESIRDKRKPEHLRASSTDDVECFFSIMRDSIGIIFTTKQVSWFPQSLFGVHKTDGP